MLVTYGVFKLLDSWKRSSLDCKPVGHNPCAVGKVHPICASVPTYGMTLGRGSVPGAGGGGGVVMDVKRGSVRRDCSGLPLTPYCWVKSVANSWLDSSISKLNVLRTRS